MLVLTRKISPYDAVDLFLGIFNNEKSAQVRKFDAVFSDRELAELYAKQKESEDYDKAPNWCEVDEVLINLKR